MKKCEFIKKDGSRCRANPMRSKKYCYVHSPDIKKSEKKEASRKGGKVGKTIQINPLSPAKLDDSNDIMLLLADTINKVRSGKMDTKIANCIGYLSGHMVKIFEISNIEKRLDKLEEMVLNLQDRGI